MAEELREPCLKIDRAQKHIGDLKAAVLSFRNSHPYSLVIEDDPNGIDELVIVRQIKEIPAEVYLTDGATMNVQSRSRICTQ
jgi:hypothetical protein